MNKLFRTNIYVVLKQLNLKKKLINTDYVGQLVVDSHELRIMPLKYTKIFNLFHRFFLSLQAELHDSSCIIIYNI